MTPTPPTTDALTVGRTVADALAGLPRVVDLLAARAEEHDRDATFPYQGVEAVHEAGLLTLTVAQRHGGPGGGLADTVAVLAGLGRGDASVAVLTACTLLRHAEQARTGGWPAAAYRRLLTESRRGPTLLNTLRAEPGGTGALPATVARRDGEQWLLTGRKTGCAGAEALAWMAVWARTDERVPRTGLFLLRGDGPGIEIDPVWDQLGLRASSGHDVVLTAAPCPAGQVLGLAAPGEVAPLEAAWHDLAFAAVQLGVARAAQDWLVRYLATQGAAARHRNALGELEAALIVAEELLAGLAGRIDRGCLTAASRAGAARLHVVRTATDAVQQAVSLTGTPGLSRRHPLERHLRDSLSGRGHFTAEDLTLDGLAQAALDRR
ncbi:acyl-CoA dehydrogenase [Kitasatospora sp. MMS16-BH015]|uniref:acyl-CoA dehydrogenase family protein n=1 Tax=Kitasatospora sp. MMS16-BH015 TaxID=2018025 RepID=UPI000CA232BA|nr:acyl-CoA dehydrogenase family protein [Kitasatospora sp. MMS16-BH015]AUG81355.1 acyl-CoA dehydrogenase [Kitasatospora sp. MMS16-BH015]